jgi:transcription antitermination factor NusA-like protein
MFGWFSCKTDEMEKDAVDEEGFFLSKEVLHVEDDDGYRTKIEKLSNGKYIKTNTYIDERGHRMNDLNYQELSEEEVDEAIRESKSWWQW